MKFKDEEDADIIIVRLSGKIMGGEDTIQCRDRLHDYLKKNINKFVMDMGDVEWTNSQGLGMLISCYISVKKTGGNLALARIDNIREILEMTRLIGVFDCYDSVEDARESFSVKL